ncbi:MAG: endonuclease/exonuclease/phosphatase family protein [Bacteroidia bacterium]|nr:endonuclease/exonuclease/phosphatase family protein [Bacteroidia bacterium]
MLFTILGISSSLTAQTLDPNKEYSVSIIGFYNVENLFDTVDQPGVIDEEYTPEGSNHWDAPKYQKKLENISAVIADLGTSTSPDGVAILGLSEIENRFVLEDLVKMPAIADRNYQIVHHDGPDERGVDCALIYNPKYFTLESSQSVRLRFKDAPEDKTRDQLVVTGTLMGERIHVLVAHWPSRRGGMKASQPKRLAAAALGRSIVDSILEAEPGAKIFYMGDLNDDPVNNSVRKVMNAGDKTENLHADESFNPMLDLYRKGIGTLAWGDSWNLFDQIIVTPGLLGKNFASWQYYAAKVYNKAYLTQSDGTFAGYPFRTFAGGAWLGGYSDHFPVYMLLIREK